MTDHAQEERAAFARWLSDTNAPALRRMDAEGAHAAGFAAGVAAERERCARVCEALSNDWHQHDGKYALEDASAKIRGA